MIVEVWANFDAKEFMLCEPQPDVIHKYKKIAEIEALCSHDAEAVLHAQLATIGAQGIVDKGVEGYRLKDADYFKVWA